MITFEDMLAMNNQQVAEVFKNGFPINYKELHNTQYLGVDLSLPAWVNKILWKTFRKTFYRDEQTGIIRGWNVKLEQTGYSFPTLAKKDKQGKEFSFGHYHLCSAKGKSFPRGWQGTDYLDYGVAGNPFYDVAGLGYCPIVAVNEGSNDLLLGWEVFKIGPFFIPLNDYWLLKKEGPLTVVQPVPGAEQ